MASHSVDRFTSAQANMTEVLDAGRCATEKCEELSKELTAAKDELREKENQIKDLANTAERMRLERDQLWNDMEDAMRTVLKRDTAFRKKLHVEAVAREIDWRHRLDGNEDARKLLKTFFGERPMHYDSNNATEARIDSITSADDEIEGEDEDIDSTAEENEGENRDSEATDDSLYSPGRTGKKDTRSDRSEWNDRASMLRRIAEQVCTQHGVHAHRPLWPPVQFMGDIAPPRGDRQGKIKGADVVKALQIYHSFFETILSQPPHINWDEAGQKNLVANVLSGYGPGEFQDLKVKRVTLYKKAAKSLADLPEERIQSLLSLPVQGKNVAGLIDEHIYNGFLEEERRIRGQ